MPFPHPSRTPSGPRRRTLLASAAGAALLAGCSAGPEETAKSASGTPSATERVRARAALESNGLVARYDAALAVHPALAARLAPLRAEVVRHVAAFGGVGKASPSPTATGDRTATATGGPAASPSAPAATGPADVSAPPSAAPPSAAAPATERDALVGLAAAERALADRRATELLDVPGELARLLASVAAAGAAHAFLLTEVAR
ncbi:MULTISPECIES: hypothetical protein [unclassified Streptomyces]|uniref:hypothetical protein n=1 Tax=unclassified Streptomyces TaxID=2593676 RepID=UPI000709B229|nr:MULTISPECIES: hypothetical protein [unclassified Streptomyces]KRD16986.1 hypothetical protein ASE41_24030 [Streptomyces sp. Root264]